MQTKILTKIYEDLEFLKKEVIEIKQNMIDVDAILSSDERVLVSKAREEHKKGETTSLEEIKKELSNNVYN
ncbi:MAG: hypothetical protein AABY14_03760 [Nanoarchaeota archaeon]